MAKSKCPWCAKPIALRFIVECSSEIDLRGKSKSSHVHKFDRASAYVLWKQHGMTFADLGRRFGVSSTAIRLGLRKLEKQIASKKTRQNHIASYPLNYLATNPSRSSPS